MAAVAEQGAKPLLDLPAFAAGTTPELRRIEQDRVIAPLAPHFARGELARIVDDPAHRLVGHAGERGIFARLSHRLLRRIDMRHRGPRGGERLAADAGIAEEVEESGIGLVGNLAAQPVPHRRHIGKEAQMPKRRALGGEARLAPRERPAFGGHGLVIIPAPPTVVVRCRNKLTVGGFPFAGGQRGRPHRLRLGADEAIGAIAFELAPAAAVHQSIIVPRLTNERDERQKLSHARLPRG